jgi:hypothetical protein
MKSKETYLENPYKSHCSYYSEKSHNPFNLVSHEDCITKCVRNNCFFKYKCLIKKIVFFIRKSDKFSTDTKNECNRKQENKCKNNN